MLLTMKMKAPKSPKPTMDDLLSQYYAAYLRANGCPYLDNYENPIAIKGSWFILNSCKVQRTMFLTMIDRLNARG